MALLLDAGVDIDAADKKGKTACYVAIQFNQFDALKLLVDRGANVRVLKEEKLDLISLLGAASRYGDARIVHLLLDAGRELTNLVLSVSLLHRLVARNVKFGDLYDFTDVDFLRVVISNAERIDDIAGVLRAAVKVCEIDVNYCEWDGETALHCAAYKANLVAIRTLVELGAVINCSQKYGRTPCTCSAMAGERPERVQSFFSLTVPMPTGAMRMGATRRAISRHAVALLCCARWSREEVTWMIATIHVVLHAIWRRATVFHCPPSKRLTMRAVGSKKRGYFSCGSVHFRFVLDCNLSILTRCSCAKS
jgi:hypothetical protein